MQIPTTRFGQVEIEADDIILFPNGLAALEEYRHWVLLADAENESVAWLQSVSRADLAVPVVSPRRFQPEYQVRVNNSQLVPIQLDETDHPYVLAIVSRNQDQLTMNLHGPVLINLDRRLGTQVITLDEQPIQFALAELPSLILRKIA